MSKLGVTLVSVIRPALRATLSVPSKLVIGTVSELLVLGILKLVTCGASISGKLITVWVEKAAEISQVTRTIRMSNLTKKESKEFEKSVQGMVDNLNKNVSKEVKDV